MPSHIEITKPENLVLRNFELNNLVNDLTRRMLHYDSIAKKMIYERRILENQLKLRGEEPALPAEDAKKIKTKSKKSKKKRI
jgi:hypothetical protein